MATTRSVVSFPRPEDVFLRLEKQPIAPVYLFYGEEPYLVDQAVACVRRRLGEAWSGRVFYAGEDSLAALLSAWGGPSLFAAHSLLILKNAQHLKATERDLLLAEAELRDATQPLVVCASGRVDLRQKFYASCAKRGFVAEFRALFPNQVGGWVQRFARERAVRLSDDATHVLTEMIGPNLSALAAEVDKLAAFVFPNTEIDSAVVNACAGHLPHHRAFDLADALGRRDCEKAVRLLQSVLADERDALPVLHALVAHFRRLWQLKELAENGAQETQMERAVGLRGQRLHNLRGQARLYTIADLRRFLHSAAALDLTLKSSRTPPSALFCALLLEVCARSA